ncbi:non-heme iron oxygenase ferredoxin subunit [Methylomonas paludis]|uniref:Non-heme iron oxygenase ferredoxin subunit n=1 Tax=Methylomonas paludis TaxID=1173101 RepID=A0A975MLE6_9GAMM|nr:non-heme iron oxygenase ferredoxin subunit [Methylomonas paludis]QWF70006.1 non-heme iron oxygenase ferredoxin subunit [Methylomonas paludis]
MTDWIDVIDQTALAEGEHILTEVDGEEVAVFKIAGKCYAIVNTCSHDGGEIASGDIIGNEIVCPRHAARFCLKTGAVKSPPAYENIQNYAVRINNGRLEIKQPE